MLPFYDASTSMLRLDDHLVYVKPLAFMHPIDSASMQIEHWQSIAQVIVNHYDLYDGFVILHGTDTLAYTASALSFMLQNLEKPVILTGAQRPIGTSRSDAVQNLMTSIECAAFTCLGREPIPEVLVYFNDRFFRGNRCTKVSSRSYQAFASPSFPSLAKAGVKVSIRKELCLKPEPGGIRPHLDLLPQVICLPIFPGMDFEMMNHILHTTPARVIILRTFGSGTTPENPVLMKAIATSISKGTIIINSSQCLEADVRQGEYESSAGLAGLGVLPALDMTFETVLTKSYHLLGQGLSTLDFRPEFHQSIAGELSREKYV